jgi:hypothetical protein
VDVTDELYERLLKRSPDEDHDTVERLIALFSETTAKAGALRLGVPEATDLWARMIVAAQPEPYLVRWAYEALSLACIGQDASEKLVLVDREADGDGYRRVYLGDTDEAHLALLFTDVDTFVEWVLDHLDKKGNVPKAKLDAWARDARSAERCIEPLMHMHPARIFEGYRMKRWLEPAPSLPAYRPGGVGASRSCVLQALQGFLRDKQARLPDRADDADVLPVLTTLIEQLEDLGAAMAEEEVPSIVAEAALSDDAELADAATRWMELFDRARSQVNRGDPAMVEATQQMLAGIRNALEEMRRRELLELDAPVVGALADELLEVALKAMPMATTLGRGGPKHLLTAIRESLLDSDRIEDCFADDREIDRIFGASLGLKP